MSRLPINLGQELLAYIADSAQEVDPDPAARRMEFFPISAFMAMSFAMQWLVEGILVAGQPAMLGGPKKGLKSSLIFDLLISLAAGVDFLGRFPVPRRVRVGVVNGESGGGTIQETIRRICRAKRISADRLDGYLFIGLTLPRLDQAEDLFALEEVISELDLDVVVIDPLYLCLLSGLGNRQASNLFDMGPLLAAAARACMQAGATPIFVHHATQAAARSFEPPELENLAFAGVQEFARQWLLVGRRARYEEGTGLHELWLAVGGSAGHSGLWAIDVNEGQLRTDFSDRQWDVTVRTAPEERSRQRTDADERRDEARRQRQLEDMAAVRRALENQLNGLTFTAIRARAAISGDRTRRALDELVERGEVAHATVTVRAGAVGTRETSGFRHRRFEPNPDLDGLGEPVDAA